jgi:hypothetical protein
MKLAEPHESERQPPHLLRTVAYPVRSSEGTPRMAQFLAAVRHSRSSSRHRSKRGSDLYQKLRKRRCGMVLLLVRVRAHHQSPLRCIEDRAQSFPLALRLTQERNAQAMVLLWVTWALQLQGLVSDWEVGSPMRPTWRRWLQEKQTPLGGEVDTLTRA